MRQWQMAIGSVMFLTMAPKPKAKPAVEELDPAYVAAIEEARADVDAGRTIPYEEVRRWLLSWGTETEVPPPRCK